MTNREDLGFLERAAGLAARGWGQVHPNPMVGCVIVKEGAVVGEGFHGRYGGPHAEVVALQVAGVEAAGATAYVTLEPCRHTGKTPPCTTALVEEGITRVVYGAPDPGSEAGGGARVLRAAGIEVEGPVWDEQRSWRENPAFHMAARGAGPFVALKLAASLDGAIAERAGATTALTGTEAAVRVHELRRGFDAILVGGGTARTDDPSLTVRHAPPARVPPLRLVLDTGARLPVTSRLLTDSGPPVHLFVGEAAEGSRRARLQEAGASIHPTPVGAGGLDLDAVLARCRALDIGSILCEGGGRLASSLLRSGRVDRVFLLIAPVTLGAAAVPAFPDGEALDWSGFVPGAEPERLGRDALLVFDRRIA